MFRNKKISFNTITNNALNLKLLFWLPFFFLIVSKVFGGNYTNDTVITVQGSVFSAEKNIQETEKTPYVFEHRKENINVFEPKVTETEDDDNNIESHQTLLEIVSYLIFFKKQGLFSVVTNSFGSKRKLYVLYHCWKNYIV